MNCNDSASKMSLPDLKGILNQLTKVDKQKEQKARTKEKTNKQNNMIGAFVTSIIFNVPPGQRTPASSPWSQLCVPQPWWLHSPKLLSDPEHPTSSSQISPEPSPNAALATASALLSGSPS